MKVKFYEVTLQYYYYDCECYGCGGEERVVKGFFSTFERAKEVAKSKEVEDYAIEHLDGDNYGHQVEISIVERTMDAIEEFGKEIYSYQIKEKIVGEANDEWRCKLAIVIRKDENGETKLDRKERRVFKYEFDSFEEDEA